MKHGQNIAKNMVNFHEAGGTFFKTSKLQYCICRHYTAKTKYRKFETNIPRKGTALLQRPNYYIHVFVSDLYIPLIGLPTERGNI
jgi:hypothetical protein